MHRIYGLAKVVIAALGPKSVDESFLVGEQEPIAIKMPFKDKSPRPIDIWVEEQTPLLPSALETRAWVLQECLLASRLLVYSDEGVVWCCNSLQPLDRWSETRYEFLNLYNDMLPARHHCIW